MKRSTIFFLSLFLLAVAALAWLIDLRTLLRFPYRDTNPFSWSGSSPSAVSTYPFPEGYNVKTPRSSADIDRAYLAGYPHQRAGGQ